MILPRGKITIAIYKERRPFRIAEGPPFGSLERSKRSA